MDVAIIGKGPGRELAPKIGEGITTWGVNDIVRHRQCDVCFWMDRHLQENSDMDRVIVASVNKTQTPMYSAKKWKDVPTAKVYPVSRIKSFFGTDYFADSCCYMLALAIYKGFTHIHVYGFTYAWGSVYVTERPCVEFWLGMAMGRGITVSVYGEHSALFQTHRKDMYSYETPQDMSRENMKVTTERLPKGNVKLSVVDRVKLLGQLPETGSYSIMRLVGELRRGLLFNTSEQKKLNFRQVKEKDKHRGPALIWDSDHGVPDKVFKMTPAQKATIASWVKALNRKGEIDCYNMSLYEKFCLGRSK